MPRNLACASDAELLALCQVDDEAFALFYRRYERLVAGWLMRQTCAAELAADLTAEVFAAAYLAAPRFRDEGQPAAGWLLGIARNKLLNSWRTDRAERSARQRLGVQAVAVSDESLRAVEELAECELTALLEELPSEQRAAVRERVLGELQYSEIARRRGISEQTARKRVSRGLSALRRRAREQGASG